MTFCATTRAFTYDGASLESGEIFTLAGGRNDARLFEVGYVVALPPDVLATLCPECGRRFYGAASLDGHVRRGHPDAAPRNIGGLT